MNPGEKDISCKYLVVGGGIAGVSCVEKLCEISRTDSVVLVSMSSVVKRVANLRHISKILTSFDVVEEKASKMESTIPNLKVLTHSQVVDIDYKSKIALTNNGVRIQYEKTCLCLGARPNMPFKDQCDAESLRHILTIRDVESVSAFQSKLSHSSRIAVIGNGGIAAEVVYSLKNVDVLWAIKDTHLISVFCDEVSGEFLLNAFNSSQKKESLDESPCVKRFKYSVDSEGSLHHHHQQGAALGPDWHSKISIEGKSECGKFVHIEKSAEIKRIYSSVPDELKISEFGSQGHDRKWNVYLEFCNGNVYGVDFIVSATGVIPNGDQLNIGLELSNGAINVDENMATNLPNIYAAGDVCYPIWENASPEWFQMRLWTQARQMGAFAGIRMADEEEGQSYLDFCFELFSHVTTFFGYKVVLLGLYNAQSLNRSEYEVELRITEGKEFVKIIKSNGRLKGAILIGETELEETFENLILNQLNVSGIDLLDPVVDIDDYFD